MKTSATSLDTYLNKFIVSVLSNYFLYSSVQSLLAALGSIQFISNIAFAYFVLNKMVTVKYVKI